ncbi:SDR family oxidoreductase [Streptomyces capparidis]
MSVLFTGATGFLGSRVLRVLLAQGTGESVTVLGRGSPAELRERVVAAVSWPTPLPPGALGRLRHLPADLTEPRLGMDARDRDRAARGVTAVWHFAASTALQGDPAALYRANVLGTRAVLELAGEAPGARVLHVSTAYVAGRRATGRVMEDDLTEEHGFETYYEETKYTAERLVRSWARESGRSVTVLRPSLLVTDRAVPEGLPEQPFATLLRVAARTLRVGSGEAEALAEVLGGGALPDSAARFRLEGDPRGSANLLQAEYAATAMARVAAAHRDAGPGVTTVHVTHPRNTSFAVASLALKAVHPGLDVTIEPVLRGPTPYEAVAAERAGFLLAFSAQRRTYDRTNLLRAVGGLPDPKPITSAYLARVITACARPEGTALERGRAATA